MSVESARRPKLTITPCTLSNNQLRVQTGSGFEAMLNPAKYSHGYQINYAGERAFGEPFAHAKFSNMGPETVGLDLVLDGTGVASATAPSVKAQIDALNGVVYRYNGDDHEPGYVQLLWGTFIFYGRLTTMSIDYTLFKPTGEPLRATVKLAFRRFMSKREEALVANQSSPDLTHIIQVKAGDTLPLLCHRIYKDASYYPEVARANGLVNFRHLEPGSRLYFPPLE